MPQNGKGNVKGNRTTVDQLRRNDDGTYTIVETKLRSTTNLSPGQSKANNHVRTGNQKFEVRSKVNELNLRVGDEITVTDYKRINKYE